MTKVIAQKWHTHKPIVVAGGQVITVLGLLAGIYTTYLQNKDTDSAVHDSSAWMKESIKTQSREIESLKISNAVLKQELEDLKYYNRPK